MWYIYGTLSKLNEETNCVFGTMVVPCCNYVGEED